MDCGQAKSRDRPPTLSRGADRPRATRWRVGPVLRVRRQWGWTGDNFREPIRRIEAGPRGNSAILW